MATQYFDPYYQQWDDGTYGKVNISDAEAAATERARRFHAQSLDRPTLSFFEPPQSDWSKRADAWLKKTGGKTEDSSSRGELADRPFDNNNWRRKALPDLLQPGVLERRVKWQEGYYGLHDQQLQSLLKEFSDSPTWRQAELQGPYSDLKGKVDATRSELNKQKQNLANARWLESRDAEMLKLAKEDPDFEVDEKTVRRIYADFETKIKPAEMLDAKINVTKTMLGFYELRSAAQELTGELHPDLETFEAEWKKFREQLAALTAEKEKLVSDAEKKTIGSKEYRSAHVNASNKLTDKGLNVKGFNLAGRLLAITPYDEVKSLINAARTGGIVDEDGNFPSPEEIRETKVDSEINTLFKYLSEPPEERARREAEVEASVEKSRVWRREEAEKEAKVKAVETNEKRITTRLLMNNKKLTEMRIDH